MLQYVTPETLTHIRPSAAHLPSRHHPFHSPAASGVSLDLSFGDVQNNGSPMDVPPRPPDSPHHL